MSRLVVSSVVSMPVLKRTVVHVPVEAVAVDIQREKY